MDEKYIELFIDEANEHIDDLNRSLLELEQDQNNPEIVNEIFRVAHTLKSSAGFVGLEYLSRLAHKMEDLFQLIRDNKVNVNLNLLNLLFSCLDTIKSAVRNVEDNKEEDKESINHLIQEIDLYINSNIEQTEKDKKKEEPEVKVIDKQPTWEESKEPKTKESVEDLSEEIKSIEDNDFLNTEDYELSIIEKNKLSQFLGDSDKVFHGYVVLDEEAPMKNLRLLLIYNRLYKNLKIFKVNPEYDVLESNPNIEKLSFIVYGNTTKEQVMKLCQIDLVQEVNIKELDIKKDSSNITKDIITQKVERKVSPLKPDISESIIKTKNIKVSSEKIDYILNNVGELVITNSGLQKIYEDLYEEFGENESLSDLKSKIDQAIRIARELQSGIMKMRMMPVGIVFQRFFRPVRDLSISLGKKVELKIMGEETELDKNIIDSLNDPLMHLIRNAIDHGIEPPQERLKKGKPEYGQIILKSYQSGNHIFIEVQDDGRGLDKEKILKKARSMGLLDNKNESQLSDLEIYNFIFYPGFSTAEEISNVSGRGVGMNVVKQITDEFKGGIQIHSEPDKGTSFILMFPLTLAIISTIHVKVQGEEYAFPLSDVVETIRIPLSQITTLQGRSIINLRKEIVPIYELAVLMGLPSKLNQRTNTEVMQDSNENSEMEEEYSVVVASVGNKKIGYIVEEMIGKKEIVIKSLEQNYKHIPGLIGACLLGDGSIVMVLDVNGLLELATKHYEERISNMSQNFEILEAIKKYNNSVKLLSKIYRKGKKKAPLGKSSLQKTEEVKDINNSNGNKVQETNLGFSESVVETTSESIENKIENVVVIEKKENIVTEDLTQSYVFEEFKKDKERRQKIGIEIFKENDVIESLSEEAYHLLEDEKYETILSKEDYEKLFAIINSGMVNAGLVLSQLLGVTIHVAVPEFKTINFKQLINFLKDTTYYSIFLETSGEFESLLALCFDENTGINTAAELMGLPVELRTKEKMELEDIRSVLNELTNIVGSSLLNEIANRTGMTIKPTVPEFHLDTRENIIKIIEEKKHPKADENIIYISTDFLRDETELLGKLFWLPSKPNLLELMKKLK